MLPEAGHCAMRGSCGKKSIFGKELPCPDDGLSEEPDEDFRASLVQSCGAKFASGPVCCTSSQLDTLAENLQLASTFINSCPACANNFRDFFCAFTCSPDQGTFVRVVETQETTSGEMAVKKVQFSVGSEFAKGFYDSCASVQFGAANDLAMSFIGGGAKTPAGFLSFMGKESDFQGSPFQIDFPSSPFNSSYIPLSPSPLSCSSEDLGTRCACVDCPSVCPSLPYVPPPSDRPTCRVGLMSCTTFTLTLTYSLFLASFLAFVAYRLFLVKGRAPIHLDDSDGDALALSTDGASTHQTLVGATSTLHPVESSSSSAGALSVSRSHLGFGRGASLLDPLDTHQPRQHMFNAVLRKTFFRLGFFCAAKPFLTLAIAAVCIALLNIGWARFGLLTDPVGLWVAPGSESAMQKQFFDEHFGPFYRTEQMFFTSVNKDEPALSWDRLNYLASLDTSIRSLKSESGLVLEDVCFAPAGKGTPCVVQAPLAWFPDLEDQDETTWVETLRECATTPSGCLAPWGQPLAPRYALGGVPDAVDDADREWEKAKAAVMTYVVQASLNETVQAKVEEWERTIRVYIEGTAVHEARDHGLQLAFSTGVSLEEELNKSANTDVRVVVLSYIAMFIYVSLTLGGGRSSSTPSYPSPSSPSGFVPAVRAWFSRAWRAPPLRMLVTSKITLALTGILLVIIAISSSAGFFSLLGVKATLIIAEVIPFLVLAVGVDNVFILVHELDRQNGLHGPNSAQASSAGGNPGTNGNGTHPANALSPSMRSASIDDSLPSLLPPEERVARALAKMGPSILLSTVTEVVAFALGALVPMPAVRNFALYAAGSVLLDGMLQMTVFVSAMALDLRRVESNRIDIFPCWKLPSRIALQDSTPNPDGGFLTRFIRRRYAPFLLRKDVKAVVLAVFAGFAVLSMVGVQRVDMGLDQRLALPSESYLVDYFNALDNYYDVGPPVYFVSTDINATARPGQQQLCGRFTTCDLFSVTNTLEAERQRPESSFIAEPAASWIDDFMRWLNPEFDTCCRVRKDDPSVFCTARDSERRCKACFEDHEPPWNITMTGLPEGDEFMRYLKQWLISPTDEICPLAGQASYSSALSLSPSGDSVAASHFRTSHTPLKTQSDFIESFAAAHRIAESLSRSTSTTIFPYSIHYVYFDQYAHLGTITEETLSLGLLAVLVITGLALGSVRTGVIVTCTVALTLLNVGGVMGAWGISLNALSLVNLVIALGIAVEFCAHIARAFMGAVPGSHAEGQKERDERVWVALADVGPSVLSGITFTKLIGVSVLALTRSKLLEMYYFRMWLILIISGALHGLVLLPVVLSLAGGKGYPLEDVDEEWMRSAVRRRGDEYAPFLADDDSVMSD